MEQVIASGCAAVLVAAGAGKLAARTEAAVALSTYGLHGRAARAAVWALSAWELVLAAGLLAAVPGATWAATATFVAFAVGQAALLAAGHAGAPCGCLGGRGRLSVPGAAAVALLAGACALSAGAGPAGPVLTGLAVAAGALIALRGGARRPEGALEIAHEGPAIGAPTALERWLPASDGRVRLAVFTSAGCRLCRGLGPALERLVADGTIVLRTYEAEREREVWDAVDVPGAPFAVAVGPDGAVLAKGTFNTEAQLHSVVGAALERGGRPARAAPERGADSRRDFLARAATAAGAVAVAPSVASLVAPGEASAYHFCGHIYTTDSCPHPTGLPRIDARGRPVRAADGRPVDDLGRVIDGDGLPLDDQGHRLADPDGRPLPAAPRTPVCEAVGRRFRMGTRVDGAWYRCCGGRVRKLVDCCSHGGRRINGDGALTGYCYSGRTVFCVLYYDTRVPC